jgi:hypothetical protein
LYAVYSNSVVAALVGDQVIMKLIMIVVILLLLGPLRRLYLTHAAFAIPATVGAVSFYLLGAYIVARSGLQSPVLALIPFAMGVGGALGLGESVKNWCDKTFGKNEERRHDR